jgi:putative endopeptidase
VASQFDSYTVLDSVHVNGKLTLGENLADLGGLLFPMPRWRSPGRKGGRPYRRLHP